MEVMREEPQNNQADALCNANELLPTQTETQNLENNDFIIEQENNSSTQTPQPKSCSPLKERQPLQNNERTLQDLTNNQNLNSQNQINQNQKTKNDQVKSLLETQQKEKEQTNTLLKSLITDVINENKENIQKQPLQQQQDKDQSNNKNILQAQENNNNIISIQDENSKNDNNNNVKQIQHIQNLQQARTQKQKSSDKLSLPEFNKDTKIEDLVEISQNNFNFGIVIPGNIFEENLTLHNKTNENLVVKVQVLCLNQEFDDYDEYVYSIRKTTGYDYNEKYVVLLPPQKQMQFKVALKVPNIKNNGLVSGQACVQIQGLEEKLIAPIRCFVELPKVLCNKSLYNKRNSCEVIKVAIRKGKKQDARISFKSIYGGMLNMDFELLELQPQEGEKEQQYTVLLSQQSLTIQPENMFIINLLLKNNYQQQQQENEKIVLKRVLLMKVKNSSVILSFPVAIEIF